MTVLRLVQIAAILGLVTGTATALELNRAESPAGTEIRAEPAPFTPWSGGDLAILGERDTIGRGQECPTNSGSYCSDQFPVCCLIGGDYRCHASLSDCRQ
jgi:hypothetical protein